MKKLFNSPSSKKKKKLTAAKNRNNAVISSKISTKPIENPLITQNQ